MIHSSCISRFRLFEREILSYSANLSGKSVAVVLDNWLSFEVRMSLRAYRDFMGRLEIESSASEVQFPSINELLLLSNVCCGWLVLADGQIVRVGMVDARAQEYDLVCLFKGSPGLSIVRKVDRRYKFVSSGDIIDGPYGPGVKFDESFWTDRDLTTFELI